MNRWNFSYYSHSTTECLCFATVECIVIDDYAWGWGWDIFSDANIEGPTKITGKVNEFIVSDIETVIKVIIFSNCNSTTKSCRKILTYKCTILHWKFIITALEIMRKRECSLRIKQNESDWLCKLLLRIVKNRGIDFMITRLYANALIINVNKLTICNK